MSRHNTPAFKNTQFFDWDSEPVLERSSTAFRDETLSLRATPRPKRRSWRGAWLVAGGLAIGTGVVGLIQLVPLIHHRLMGLG